MSSGAAAQDHNILDTVAQRPAASPARPRPTRFVWLLLPLIAAVGWALSSRLKPVTTPPEHPAPVVALMPTPQPPAPTAPPATQVPPASEAGAGLAASASGGTQTNPFGALASAPTAKQPPAPSTQPEAVAKPALLAPSKVDALAVARKPAAKPPAKTTTQSARAVPPAARPKPADTKTPAKTTVAARSSHRKADPDVELLSAIMKHLDDGAGKAAAPARSAQTIAELVKSCQSHDAIEALLCQRRICEGSWGKAQACPVHLAPKSAAKTPAL